MASIESILGPYIARAHDETDVESLKMMRRYSLELDGITFPTAEVEETLFLWKAKAARDRGACELNDDCSVVDPGDFEYANAATILQDNRTAIVNAEKLNTMIELEMTARAAVLVLERYKSLGDTDSVGGLTQLIDLYKNIIQTLLKLDKWDHPWHSIVNEEFPGEAMQFPMTLDNMEMILGSLSSKMFEGTIGHFSYGIHWINFLNTIESLIAMEYGWKRVNEERQKRNIGRAVVAAMHYAHSPEAASQFIVKHNGDTVDIDWEAKIRDASQKRADRQ